MSLTYMRVRLETAAKQFPLAPRRVAVRQGARLIRAQKYLADRGIYAILKDSRFDYKMSMGSVLS